MAGFRAVTATEAACFSTSHFKDDQTISTAGPLTKEGEHVLSPLMLVGDLTTFSQCSVEVVTAHFDLFDSGVVLPLTSALADHAKNSF